MGCGVYKAGSKNRDFVHGEEGLVYVSNFLNRNLIAKIALGISPNVVRALIPTIRAPLVKAIFAL
jgi:hypothetical protein